MKASDIILFIVCMMALPLAAAQLDGGDLGGIDPNDTGSGIGGGGSDLPPEDTSDDTTDDNATVTDSTDDTTTNSTEDSTDDDTTDDSTQESDDGDESSGSSGSDSSLPDEYEECLIAAREKYPQASQARIKELCQHAVRTERNDTSDGKVGACLSALRLIPGDHQDLCERVVQERERCQEILSAANIPNPAAVCTRLFNPVPVAAQTQDQTMLKEAIRTMQQQRFNVWSDRKPEIRQFMESLSEERAAVYGALSIAEQKKIMQEGAAALDRYRIRNVSRENLFKNRIVSRERLETAKNQLDKARERYNNAVEKHNEAINKWKEAKQNLTGCAGTEECKKLETKAVEQARRFLLNHIELASAHLERIKSRAEESERLTEDQVEDITEAIDADLAKLAELKEDAAEAQSKEEIKEVAKSLNDMWKNAMVKAKLHAEIIAGTITGEVIQRSEHLEQRLACVLGKMDDQNISTSELESLIEQFSGKVASAEEHFENAKEYFEQFQEMGSDNMTEGEIEQAKELHSKAQEEHKAANNELREAHAVLVQITKKIREMGGRLDACSEDETSLVVEEE